MSLFTASHEPVRSFSERLKADPSLNCLNITKNAAEDILDIAVKAILKFSTSLFV